MAKAFSPSPWETKANGPLSPRSARSTELLPGQSELQSETLCQKPKINLKKSVPEITASETFVTADLNVVFSFAFAFDAGLYCLFMCGGDGICSST